MNDLVTWLRAVLDEDERLLSGTRGQVLRLRGSTRQLADWVLADVEAKRAILDEYVGTYSGRTELEHGELVGLERGVRLLASAYRDRSGYLEEWRP